MKNNEQYGIAVEVFLANLFNVEMNEEYKKRASIELFNKLEEKSKQDILEQFKDENIKIKAFSGERQGLHDFILNNNLTLSVKSNIGNLGKVCPQYIGQATSKTFFNKIGITEIPEDYNTRKELFKEYVFNNLEQLTNTYFENLFSSDYLFYIYELNEKQPNFFLLSKLNKPNFSNLKLSKSIKDWKSSNQLLINNKVLGEFQIHNNRDCFKFRFNMKTLLSLYEFKTERLELKNEDCLVYLKSIPDNSIDLILIDPPYKISRDTGFANGEEKGTDVDRFRVSYQFGNWDNSRDILPQVIKEAYRVLKKHGSIVCFYDLWKITDLRKWLEKNNFKQIRFAEWVKTNPVPINSKLNYLTNSREAIITAVKVSKPTFNSAYDNGIYSHPINHEKGRFHPTQKPVKLIEELILKHSNENDVILDCFSGSGTTMLACNNLNRRFMGCEISPKYFYKSIKRIQKNTSN